MYVTKRDIPLSFGGYDHFVIPKGTALTQEAAGNTTVSGYFFLAANEAELIELFGKGFWIHDMYYRGVRVEEGDAELLPDPIANAQPISANELMAIPWEVVNKVRIGAGKRASGIFAWRYSNATNTMVKTNDGNSSLEPFKIWFMNEAQAASFGAYLRVVDEIKRQQEKRIALLLEAVGI